MVTISITAARWSASKRVEALAADYRSPRNATRSRNGNRPLAFWFHKAILDWIGLDNVIHIVNIQATAPRGRKSQLLAKTTVLRLSISEDFVILLLLLYEPRDQRPLMSTACPVMSCHLLRCWARLFTSCSPVFWQCHDTFVIACAILVQHMSSAWRTVGTDAPTDTQTETCATTKLFYADGLQQEAQLPQRDSASATHVILGSLTDLALHWTQHLLYNCNRHSRINTIS